MSRTEPAATPSTTDVPDYLRATMDAMILRRRAGEWDIVLEDELTDCHTNLLGCLASVFDHFLGAFAWARPTDVRLSGSDGQAAHWCPERGPWEAWLATISPLNLAVDELEATLDLELACAPEGSPPRTAVLPEAGRLILALDDEGELLATLTIWPNLFTNETLIYDRDGEAFRRSRLDIRSSAQTNRRKLSAALQAFTDATGGQVVSCDSELIDGVDTQGVRNDATPL
jgi:hypothetical protein